MRLMILGGGSCQQSLIKRAKEMGHFVVVADYLTDCPGGKIADVHVLVSTFDIGGVTQAARDYQIDAIATIGTDQPVLTAATVCERLELPFYIDSKLALAVTNKRVMKRIFIENGIPTADYRLIGKDFTGEDIAGLSFPAVMKPVDSQGQRGIFLVDDIDDVRAHIAETLSYSREVKALLEEFYENDEITVNGWAVDGDVTLLSVVDRLTIKSGNRIGICLGHNFPSVHLDKNYDEIEDLTKRIAAAFGITDGPLYFQYLVGADGIIVNEIAMRIGGAYEDLTIPLIADIDVIPMLLDSVNPPQRRYASSGTPENGKSSAYPLRGYDLRTHDKFVSTQLYFCRPGTVKSVTPRKKMLSLPFVHHYGCNYRYRDVIPETENATARAGYMIVSGDSFPSMIGNVGRAFDALKICDADGQNLVIPYADYKDKYVFFKNNEH